MNVASNGRDGWPHLTALWFVMRGPDPWSWTYRKSQKVKNLERDQRATLQIEDGVLYHELRGAMLECDVDIERDPAEVEKFGLAMFERYAEINPDVEEMIRAQAQKRVGLTFRPTRIVSWDHTKLGGAY
jgi:general stress protein 26